jgi:hypothetical protein
MGLRKRCVTLQLIFFNKESRYGLLVHKFVLREMTQLPWPMKMKKAKLLATNFHLLTKF